MSPTLLYLRVGLILLALGAFAVAELVHYPVALMSLWGLLDAVRAPRRTWHAPRARLLAGLFALLWLPMAMAWFGAVNPARSGETVLLYLHFLPAAWFVVVTCRDAHALRLVTAGAAGLILFATFDAFVQLIWKVDLFGHPYEQGMLKGVFHPKQRLGLFLAVFAPLTVDAVLRWCRQYPQLWLLLLPLVVVILMSLKRSAWLMLAVGMLAYAWLRLRHERRALSRTRLVQLAVVIVLAGATVASSPSLQHRLEASSGLFRAERAAIDAASGYRLTLWQTGLAMFEAHWLTGVGPRGYRDAYRAHAAADDFWIARHGAGQTHPHLLLLEVAAECGVVGLAGFAVFYVLLWRLLRRRQIGHAVPVWLLGAAVAWFPLNAHLAFYGSYWATLGWLMLGAGLAGVRMDGDDPELAAASARESGVTQFARAARGP